MPITTLKPHEAADDRRVFDQLLPIVSPEGIGGEEFIVDVREILASRQLTNGRFVREFERAAANYLGVPHCVAVSSCTSGLMLTLAALRLSGEVILPSFTFHATAHAVAWNGLKPVFVDCDADTFCISPRAVRERISSNTAAIVAVHIFGNPAAVAEFEQIASDAGIPLIYDGAHAFGSKVGKAHIGAFGAAEVFSLSPTKLLVAGEGGLVTTRDPALANRLRAARNYGDAGDSNPEIRGLNGRMSEFHAALAIRGLDSLEERVERRNEIRTRYEQRLSEAPGIGFQHIRARNRSSCKDFQIVVDCEAFGCSRDAILQALRQRNIEARRYFWPPVHRQKLYFSLWDGHPLPVTDRISEGILSLPIYSSLRDDEVDAVCDGILTAGRTMKPRAFAKGQSA